MSELIALIDAYRRANGMPPDSAVARKAGMHKQRISLWRTQGVKTMLSPEQVAGLAAALGVSREKVVLAAAIDLGLLVAEPPTPTDPERETGDPLAG